MNSESFFSLAQQAHIGSDETLKGDTFGGLVVCACFVDDHQTFTRLGIVDSKRLTEPIIRRLGKLLLDTYPHHFAIKTLLPETYNQFTKTQSVTLLLNQLHREVALELVQRHGNVPHLVDAFPGCNAGTLYEHQAEQKSLGVAAASIVARYIGLLQFEELSKKAGFTLPMGSTHVTSALHRLLAEHVDLFFFAKLHFKNVQHAQRTHSFS